jgi:hypothetical protein
VNDWLSVELARERKESILAEAKERQLARQAPHKAAWTTLRARAARRMFQIAVALEKEETWRAVWERLEAPRHS